MPNIKKYKSVSVPIEIHEKLRAMSKTILEDAEISITKVIEILATKESKQYYLREVRALEYREERMEKKI